MSSRAVVDGSTRTVGLVGGLGPEATVDYYRRLLAGWELRRPGTAPSVVIDSLDVQRALRLSGDDPDRMVEYLVGSVGRLAAAGAAVAAITANTPHRFFDEVSARAAIPLLSIVEACAAEAERRQAQRLLLLGTRFTMEGDFYAQVFAKRGLRIIVPQPADRAWLHERYVNELLKGRFLDAARAEIETLVGDLRSKEAIDAVILGGTELPLLLRSPSIADLPALDTTAIHVTAILDCILEDASPADSRQPDGNPRNALTGARGAIDHGVPAPVGGPQLATLGAIRDAALALVGVAVRTPLLPAPFVGESVWLKPEMLQPAGAFKIRGAYNFIRQLDPATRARGVVAPSSGNHAQAVALAGRLLGAPVTVVLPTNVTAAKRAGVERLQARVELAGTTTAERMARACEIAAADGSVLVPSYDDVRIIAGQATIGLEVIEDLGDVARVLVPVGGGGLSAGVAAAIKQLRPAVRVIGVEPRGAPKLSRARAAGAPVRLDSTSSVADALLAVEIGQVPFAHHQRYVDDVVLVEDAAIRRAMRLLLDRAKLVTEPSGAIAVAAIMEGLVPLRGATVAILSGGNVGWLDLRETMA